MQNYMTSEKATKVFCLVQQIYREKTYSSRNVETAFDQLNNYSLF